MGFLDYYSPAAVRQHYQTSPYGAQQDVFGGQGMNALIGGSQGGYDFSQMFGNVPTLVGQQKWSGGGNSTDVFTPKGAVISAPFDGIVQTMQTMNGPVPGELVMLTDPRTGFSMRLVHTKGLVKGGQVRKGQPLAIVDDPGMDMLRWPGGQYGQAPGGYQHAQVDFANSPGGFKDGPMGGQLNALQILTQGGFRPGQVVPRTPGPPEGMGGGMSGGPMGDMGMGMFGGMGMPGMGMMGMPPMMGMGMPPMGMGMPPMFGGPGMGMGMGGPGMFPGMSGGPMGGGLGSFGGGNFGMPGGGSSFGSMGAGSLPYGGGLPGIGGGTSFPGISGGSSFGNQPQFGSQSMFGTGSNPAPYSAPQFGDAPGVGPSPQSSQNLLNQEVFGNLTSPVTSVEQALRKHGISPMSGDPRVKAIEGKAGAVLAPVYAQIAANPGSIDNLPDLIDKQVTAAMAGSPVLFSPTEGRQAWTNISQAASQAQNALLNGGGSTFSPGLDFLLGTLTNDQDALSLFSNLMLGGLPSNMQNTIGSSYRQLPALAAYLASQHPNIGNKNFTSFVDLIMNGGF
jgi:hypothetical protein